MEKTMIRNKLGILFALPVFLLCNCFIMSTYHTAVLLEPGQEEIVPIADLQYSWWERMGNGHWMINSGARFHYGLSKNVNFGGTFLVRYNPPESDYDYKTQYRSYAEIDFKFPIFHRDRFALLLPIGFDWPYSFFDDKAILFSPTLLFSYPFTDRFSLTTTLRLSGYVLFSDGCPGTIPLFTPYVSVSSGIKLNQEVELRPSVGVAIGEGIAGVGGGVGICFKFKNVNLY